MSRLFMLVAGGAMLIASQVLADPGRWMQEGWKTDFDKTSVEYSEILSGGPPRDGIPSIDHPKFVPVSRETEVDAKEPVILLDINGDVRGYPLRILTWHEIVNDIVGGLPVAVTYCPLCNASLVFERRVGDRILEFGTTGKLRKSDLVMYDRQTESWWQQFTGEAIVGELQGTGLTLVPSRIVSMRDFRDAHPEAKVLVPNDPNLRKYGVNPYAGYDSMDLPFMYKGELPEDIEPMARVVVVRTGREPIIVEMTKVVGKPFEKEGYRIEWKKGVASALDQPRMSLGKDVGAVQVTRNGLDVVHDVTFAFVAHAFHPNVPIIRD